MINILASSVVAEDLVSMLFLAVSPLQTCWRLKSYRVLLDNSDAWNANIGP